jgi:hypothetical protein
LSCNSSENPNVHRRTDPQAAGSSLRNNFNTASHC